MKTALLASLLCLGTLAGPAAQAAPDVPAPVPASAPGDAAFPGVIDLQVDATDLHHRILKVRQTLQAAEGRLTLMYPRWLPGTHSPSGDVNFMAGLAVRDAAGRVLPWTRDAGNSHAFHVDVPAPGTALTLEFSHLSPLSARTGRPSISPALLGVQWETVVLYPAGHPSRRIQVRPSLRLPTGWQQAAALRDGQGRLPQPDAEGWVRYAEVDLETLVDSPVFAGRHVQRIDLEAPGARRPVVLHLMADEPEQLKHTPAQMAAHRQLVVQADRLFGARHFQRYDFLLALSSSFGGMGLEHHQSSENAVEPEYFKDWDKGLGERDLLPHEYVHSWNGKFRRPAELLTSTFDAPMRDTLLWVYEGQTQYWGGVLAARSGLVTAAQQREAMALVAAAYEHRSGRTWRSLQDTAHEPIVGRQRPKDWPNFQRGADYYDEGALVWLDADTLIRERSQGKRSLDDFARRFFGMDDGRMDPLPYTFDDVVRTLNEVQPHDWAGFLRTRLDAVRTGAPIDGLARGGWQLAYDDQPSDLFKASEGQRKHTNLLYSVGLVIRQDATIADVAWDGPAFRAGMAPGAKVVAVNERAYKPELLQQAITAAKDGTSPLALLLQEGERFRTVSLDYRGGLRYPKLERRAGTPDRLGAILAPR